jgi:hypothetical protein
MSASSLKYAALCVSSGATSALVPAVDAWDPSGVSVVSPDAPVGCMPSNQFEFEVTEFLTDRMPPTIEAGLPLSPARGYGNLPYCGPPLPDMFGRQPLHLLEGSVALPLPGTTTDPLGWAQTAYGDGSANRQLFDAAQEQVQPKTHITMG